MLGLSFSYDYDSHMSAVATGAFLYRSSPSCALLTRRTTWTATTTTTYCEKAVVELLRSIKASEILWKT